MDIFMEKLLRFCFVGMLGMGVDFGFTWLCKEELGCHKYIANGIGFSCAVCSNYLLNRLWTFQSNGEIGIEFMLFMLASFIGLLINTSFLWLGNSWIKLPFYFAKLTATGITVIWNFSISYFITFALYKLV